MTVLIGGVESTGSVLFETARFETSVNGVPGTCSFRYRDDTANAVFTVGQPIVLTINGVVLWRGFITRVTSTYVFPAYDTSTFLTRFFDIEGSDLNLLFTRRVTFKQSSPAAPFGPTFAAGTSDLTVIQSLLAGYLDLSGDGLDTTSYVDSVGSPDPYLKFRAWDAGWTWGDAMANIAKIPGAIYYIDPDANLVYCDPDVPNAPFGLSDQADNVTTVGYSDMEVLKDGSSLANDILAWGFGYGSQVPVFKRAQSTASQATHGLWQTGNISSGVYKQGTVDRIATSILDGSPQNHRGHKDDRYSVMVTVRQPGFRAAQKVPFTSNVFGYSATLPIRKMEITFAGPDNPIYKLTLSFDIDPAWTMFDPFQFGGFNYRFPPIEFPPIVDPPPPGGCTDVICGITDTFTRTVVGGWGTSDSSLTWIVGNPGVDVLSVSPGYGSLSKGNASLVFPVLAVGDTARLTIERTTGTYLFNQFQVNLLKRAYGGSGPGGGAIVMFPGDSSLGQAYISGQDGSSYSPITCTLTAALTVVFTVVTGGINVSINGSAVVFVSNGGLDGTLDEIQVNSPFSGAVTYRVSNLDITGVNRCTEYRFDNFNRTVSSGWGTSDYGDAWAASLSSGALASVTGSQGRITFPGTAVFPASNLHVIDTAGPWASGAFTMTTLVNVSRTQDWRTMDFQFDTVVPSPQVDCSITLRPDTGRIVVSNDFDGDSNFVTYAWPASGPYGFYVKAERVPGASWSVKVWSVTDPEPLGWTVATTASASALNGFDVLTSGVSSVASTATIDFDYIDFDYTGKPCYQSCGFGGATQGIYDSFQRIDGPKSWGYTDLLPYHSQDHWVIEGGDTDNGSVDGSKGILTASANTFATATVQPYWYVPFLLSFDYSISAGAGGVLLEVGQDSSYGPDFTWYMTGGTMTTGWFSASVASLAGTSGTITLDVTALGITAYVGGTSVGFLGWGASPTATLFRLFSIAFIGGTHATETLTIDNIRIADSSANPLTRYGSYCVDVEPGAGGIGGGGGGSEVATTTNNTLYQLTSSYFPGSTIVSVNGLVKIRGTDYTESSPILGQITFITPLTGTPTVNVTFISTGAL